MRRRTLTIVGAAFAALFMLAVAGSAADTFEVRLVSQTSSTITLGWDPQPGYGYLFSAGGVVVSRSSDPSKSRVKLSKVPSGQYDVDVIVKGANGHYPSAASPPIPACSDSTDNDSDGKVDYPADPGCSSATDTDETDPAPPPPAAQCADGVDNDGDTKIDLADPGCSSSSDTDETDPVQPPPTGFPDASTTGVPAGTSLTAYTGPSTITTANTVISGKTIGCITIATTGVVIRNSRISGSCGYAVVNIDDRTSSQMMLTLEDSEVICTGGGGTNGVGESDMTLRRVEITGCENGGDLNQNVLIEDSYIHDLYNGGDSHLDGFQCAGGHWTGTSWASYARNLTFRHNTIYGMGDGDTTFGTSAIICGISGNTNILIDNNLLAGGAYTVYCVLSGPGVNFQVTNNHFSTRFGPKVGAFGPSDGCSDEILSGNVYHESGLPIILD